MKLSEQGSFFWASQNGSKEWYAMIKSRYIYGDLKYQLIKQQKAYVLLNFFSKYLAMPDYCSQFAWQTNPVHTLL